MTTSRNRIFKVLGAALFTALCAFFVVRGLNDKPRSQSQVSPASTTLPVDAKVIESASKAATANVAVPITKTSIEVDGRSRELTQILRMSPSARDALASARSSSKLTVAEQFYIAAMLAEKCSDSRLAEARRVKNSANIAAFNSVADNSPRASAKAALEKKRLAIYCEGLEPMTREQLDAAWALAVAAGDTRAFARAEWAKFEGGFSPDPNLPLGGVVTADMTIAPARWDPSMVNKLTQALASQDPIAIVSLGNLAQATAHENYLAIAGLNMPLSEFPIATWNVLACSYGAECGRDNTTLLSACANVGRCDAVSLEDYYRRYEWTADDAARYESIQTYLRQLIDRGDTSLLNILPYDPGRLIIRRPLRPPFRYGG